MNLKFVKLMILAVMVLMAACNKTEKPEAKTEDIAAIDKAPSQIDSIQVENLQPSVDSLILGFFDGLFQKDTALVASLVVQRKEYEAIYPLMPDADPNPNSPGFIAQMYVSGNKKHLDRWLDRAKSEGLAFSRYTIEGDEQKSDHYTLLRGVRLWVRDSRGEHEFPAFKTLFKLPGGYKIWSILDT